MNQTQHSELDALLHPVPVAYAQFWKRLLAWIVDIGLFLFLVQPLIHIYWPNLNWDYRKYAEPLALCTSFSLMALVYVPLMESTGGTLGKRICGIKPVAIETNKYPTFKKAFLRSLFVSWPLIVGLLFNGALILYANAHVQEVPDFSKMSSAEIGQNILNHHLQEDGYVYQVPTGTNMFLLTFLVILVIGGSFRALLTSTKQAWHDRYAKVIVINKK